MRQALCMRLLNAQCWVLLEVTLCGTSRPGCTPGGVTRSHRTVSLPCFPQCVEEILGYLKSCFNREPMMATVCVQQVRTCSPVLFAAAHWRRGGGTLLVIWKVFRRWCWSCVRQPHLSLLCSLHCQAQRGPFLSPSWRSWLSLWRAEGKVLPHPCCRATVPASLQVLERRSHPSHRDSRWPGLLLTGRGASRQRPHC